MVPVQIFDLNQVISNECYDIGLKLIMVINNQIIHSFIYSLLRGQILLETYLPNKAINGNTQSSYKKIFLYKHFSNLSRKLILSLID